MNIYPALKARMGVRDYYIVKMQMKDIVKEIGFASEIYENKTLDDAIQRELNKGRVKREIVNYLTNKYRFFSSIVVAALGGNPTFTPVEISDDPRFAFFKVGKIDDAFGVLTFDGGQRYFALDGQHRLKAIQTLIEQKEDSLPEIPEGFLSEEISVIILVREEESEEMFMQDYRRIFSSLNRYAKPTDQDTNIIMDEEDAMAILTRRLLNEHDFFAWLGKSDTHPKVKTKGKNINPGEPYFTSLQTLYYMNERLLKTPSREGQGFMTRERKQFRPREHELDSLYGELVMYWDAMLAEIDELKNDPIHMRGHDEDPKEEGLTDHLLFRPIGQEMFVDVIRILLNRRLPDSDSPTLSNIRACISIMANINWNLHEPPWEGLLLIPHPKNKNKWQMRSEDRKPAVEVGKRIIMVQTGLDDPTEDMLEELKTEWHALLIPRPSMSEVDDIWEKVSKQLA